MAWSDAARAAALETRRMHAVKKSDRRNVIYTPGADNVHIGRSTMAAWLREARGSGLRGKGKQSGMLGMATAGGKYYTSVKGAHFVDQGLKGLVWRQTPGISKSVSGKPRAAARGGAPKWASKSVKYYRGY